MVEIVTSEFMDDTLLEASDVISLHVPLTEETRNLIDRATIARMRRGAINAVRGGVIDEVAIANALRLGQLSGAALDDFAQEPPPKEQGELFARCPNLLLTPHIAGVTAESNARVSRQMAEKIRDHLARGG